MTVAQREDLQALGQLLQQRLQLDIPWGDTLKVGCVISNGTLVILSQHPPGLNFDSKNTFNVLKKALESLRPQVTQPVKLYLRVAGEKQAYAKYNFTLRPLETAATDVSIRKDEFSGLREQAEQITDALHSSQIQREDIDNLWQYPDSKDWLSSSYNLNIGQQGSKRRQFSLDWRSLFGDIPTPLLVVGGGVVFATILTSIYMLSRPCVIGHCQPLQSAQQLNKIANHLIRQADSQSDLVEVQQQLTQANNLLKEIPRWSFHYQQANQLSQNLSSHAAMLNQISMALEQAYEATQKAQNLPHTASEWQAIQLLWQSSIASVATIPPNSTLFGLAQQKLTEYQTNLQIVNQFFNQEQQASKKLLQAKNTAMLAKTRTDTAKSLHSWQKVKATWQTAVNTLATIPKTTTAYPEAQQLLVNYRTQLATSGDRANKEQIAAKAFSQAISQASLAQRSEQQNQISKAVTGWNQALKSAKQVPNGTQYYSQVQPLIASYSLSIQQAEAKLKVANVLQLARTDLNRTCSGNIQMCKYTANSNLILVQLTKGYEQAVDRKFVTARFDKSNSSAVVHYPILKQALEAISDNANIPLQVYDSDGSPIHSYKPK